MWLIKWGKINMETKVFPEIFGKYVNIDVCPGAEQITIQMLLNHTVGLWPTTTRSGDPMFNRKELNHRQLIQAVLKETGKVSVEQLG